MNTIHIDNRINSIKITKDTHMYIENKEAMINLEILNTSKVFLYAKDATLTIHGDIKKSLNFRIFSVNSNIKETLELNEKNISLEYFYSTINTSNHEYEMDIYHNVKNTNSKIINKGLTLTNSKLSFIVNGYVKQNSTNVNCNQENYIITMDDNNSIIKPNLIIDNNDITANHSAYIGYFKQEELFYLKARGIKEEDGLKLLAKSFLIGNHEIHFLDKERILKDLNKYWRWKNESWRFSYFKEWIYLFW